MGKGKILVPGGAGLVGQNRVARRKARGYRDIVVFEKKVPVVRIPGHALRQGDRRDLQRPGLRQSRTEVLSMGHRIAVLGTSRWALTMMVIGHIPGFVFNKLEI